MKIVRTMDNFEAFYEKNIPALAKYAAKFVDNSAAANDIALEMLNKCWERRDMFENEEHALAYVRVMIKNKALNYIRHIQSRLTVTEELDESASVEKDSAASVLSNEITAIVNDTLSKLPEKTSMIFKLCKLDKLSHKDVADQMGLTVKAVEYHIAKATKALKTVLVEYLDNQ